MKNKIMLIIFVLIFLIGTVSAFEFDNVQDYDKDKKEYLITNVLGLGKDIAKIKLTSDLNQLVPRGYQKIAEFEVENYDNYVNVFNGMEFYNLNKNSESLTRDFDYKYKTNIQVPDYRTVCDNVLNQNGTTRNINCRQEQVGLKDKVVWEEINKIDGLIRGNLTIGIFTDVKKGDKVEWIPTLFGERLTEWAVWTESLNVNLVSYYKLDESSGVVIDAQNGNNGTNNGATPSVPGIINTAYDFDGTDDNITLDNENQFDFTVMSISLWINSTTSSEDQVIAKGSGGDFQYSIIIKTDGTMRVVAFTAVGGNYFIIDSASSVSGGALHHVVGLINNTNYAKIYIDGNLNGTDSTPSGTWNTEGAASLIFGVRGDGAGEYEGVIDEVGIWDRELTASEISDLYNDGSGISHTSAFGPIVTLNSPINAFNTTNQTINFNGTINGTGIVNVTLFIDGILNETNSSGINDTDYLFTKVIELGDHNWTYESCNTDACTTATIRTFSILSFLENSQKFNASSFETANERFTINITTNGSIPSIAKLIYNGTTFTGATITNTAGNDFNITRAIDIPLVNGTKSWFFNFTIDGIELSSTTQNQIINLTNFQHITSGLSYINISFKNETIAEESVTAQIDTDWTFWLGSGTVFKTLSFTNTTENEKYEFALLNGANRTLTANVSLTYDNLISEQRSFSRAYTLTNVTTQQVLFLLPTSDGVFVTFQTVTVAEQVITNVQANVTRSGDLISTGITDDAGLVQYFLDPDTTYVFSFFKEGFTLVTTTLKPTQSSFTITMGTITAPIQNDTTKGISYTINPPANVLSNNTETEFNLTFSSVFFGLDSFGFALKNSTGNVFNITTSTTETGGLLSRTLNTGNNADIIMEVFWTISGNQTNVTRLWKVLDTSDEGFSIKSFFDDLSIYLTSGLFGLTSFGLGIIIFMIILITTGVLSTKFGITSPAGISVIVFAMVLFFDVGLGIMPNPINAVPNFPTIFVGIVFLGLFFKEAIIR